MLIAFAALAGVCFALLGTAYRLAQRPGVVVQHVLVWLGAVGLVAFLARDPGLAVAGASFGVVAAGIASGVTQWLTVRLLQAALHRGPLAPVWCSTNLGFVPVFVYASLVLGEHLTGGQWASVAAAIGCIVAGSVSGRVPDAPAGAAPRASSHVYGLLLVLTLVGNSVFLISLKHLSTSALPAAAPVAARQAALSCTMYASLLVSSLVDLGVIGRLRMPWRAVALPGALAAVGSVAGLACLSAAASLPAADAFVVSHVISIVIVSIASVVLFAERTTRAWFAMLAAGVAAVVFTAV